MTNKKCVLRIRYNTSSRDFDGWDLEKLAGTEFSGNPQADFLGMGFNKSGPLRLNINTAQFFRTFEDRSHVFEIRERPTIPFYSQIHNLNVRGKRGNIVQNYPSVEYDFVWSRKHEGRGFGNVYRWDFLHIQWTGSDSNQQGQAGNGMQMTDRHNLVEAASSASNFPKSLYETDSFFTGERDILGYKVKEDESSGVLEDREVDLWRNSFLDNETQVMQLAWQHQENRQCDHFLKLKFPNNAQRRANDPHNCAQLNQASAYFDAGLIQLPKTGTFHFLSTRNNAFTNRAQKMTLHIHENWFLVAISTLFAMVLGTMVLFAVLGCKRLPQHIKDYPNGRCARSCIGRRIQKQEADEKEERRREKSAFLQKLDRSNSIGSGGTGEKSGDADKDSSNDDSKTVRKARCCGLQCCCACMCCKCCTCWSRQSQRIKFIVVLLLINVGFGLFGYIRAHVERPDNNDAFYFAKAGGAMLNFNCAAILLPVARNMLSWLRTTPIGDVIPMDDNILFHKVIAMLILASGMLHIMSHYMNYWQIAIDGGAGGIVSILALALGSWHGITGHAIFFLMLAMFFTAGEKCRRGRCCTKCGGKKLCGFNLFWAVHKMWIPALGILILHGRVFWIYGMWPILLMIVERAIRAGRARHRMRVMEVKSLPGDVMSIRFKSCSDDGMDDEGHPFRYQAGQYLYLNCPEISRKQWHPFTISSAPEDPYVSVHIRARKDMDWCWALRQKLNPKDQDVVTFSKRVLRNSRPPPPPPKGKRKSKNTKNAGGRKQGDRTAVMPVQQAWSAESWDSQVNAGDDTVVLRVDGPYGSAAQEVFDFKSLILVGAGIGVTPFASIIRSLVLRQQMAAKISSKAPLVKKVSFYWLCRNKEEFMSFRDLMKCQIADRKVFKFNLYLSGECEVTDGEFSRQIEGYKKWSKVFTGRPNWRRIFGEQRKQNKGVEVGVFMCGPPPIARQLDKCCTKYSDPKGGISEKNRNQARTSFVFHKENF